MNKIMVPISKLKEHLEENREKHVKEVSAAKEAYMKEARARLEETIERIDEDHIVDFKPINELVAPNDHTKEYDTVIMMMEMTNETGIELTETEFKMYFQNDWPWSEMAMLANTQYLH